MRSDEFKPQVQSRKISLLAALEGPKLYAEISIVANQKSQGPEKESFQIQDPVSPCF
jgi:hypothetical protein